MAEICVKIPEDWKREIEESGLDPSLIIRNLLRRELQEIAELRSIVSRSKLTEKDVQELSEKVEESLTEELVKFTALKTISSKSKLSERDALELGRKLKSGRFDELKKRGLL